MRAIGITAEAYHVLKNKSLIGRLREVRKVRDGSYLVYLEINTYHRLRAFALEGETLSDAIIRLGAGSPQ